MSHATRDLPIIMERFVYGPGSCGYHNTAYDRKTHTPFEDCYKKSSELDQLVIAGAHAELFCIP